MTWFKVDDGWHKHRKRIRIGMDLEGFAARGLWVDCGSWAADEHSDGWLPLDVLDYLAPNMGRKLAERLVRGGVWEPLEERSGEEGFQMHDWPDYNPTREEEEAKTAKKSDGGQLGNHRRWHTNGRTDLRCSYCSPAKRSASGGRRKTDRSTDRITDRSSETVPNPPDPSRPDPTPLSSKSNAAGVDLGSSLTEHTESEVEKPAPKPSGIYALPKAWCNEHGCPDDKDCTGCLQDYGDVAHFAKLRLKNGPTG